MNTTLGPIERWRPLLAGAFGMVLGASLLAAGNAVILDPVEPRIVLSLVLLAVIGMICDLRNARPAHWTAVLPLIWFGWQCISATRTVAPDLTRVTLIHFAAVTFCFYFGLLTLSRTKKLAWFFVPVLFFFSAVLLKGIQQHYWEFEQDQQFVAEQEASGWTNQPPEELEEQLKSGFLVVTNGGRYTINPTIFQKLEKRRVFGTLMYPNSLAGAILLFTPALLVWGCRFLARFGGMPRAMFIGVWLWAAVACLYWSGSKAGWLVALGMTGVALWTRPFPARIKWIVLTFVVIGGLTGFAVKFAPYFKKGATSVSARFDYWRAAWITAKEHPVVGTGPGTFKIPYSKIKPPDAEMARLVHNDYLEQASDSGVVGFASYTALAVAGLVATYRRRPAESCLFFGIWLGLLGWFAHGLVEFSLYIPALSWPAFTMLGLLVAHASGDRQRPPLN